jgi:serine/threonine protein kinase
MNLEHLSRGKNVSTHSRFREKKPEEEVVSIFKQVVQGLVHLHQLSIVHLDIKVHNLVFASGRVKLIDLAGSLDENRPCEEQFYTPSYASPGIL